MKGASVVVDVSNAPAWEDAAVMNFFETSTRNLLANEVAAGVKHHVALSVVGTERMLTSWISSGQKWLRKSLIETSFDTLFHCSRDAIL